MTTTTTTHEAFIHRVRDFVVAHAVERATITAEQAEALQAAKLVYGVGNGSYRGVCHYGAWQNGHGPAEIVEIAATGEESWTQLAGTVIHELGHVIAGLSGGHKNPWKDATVALGFVKRPLAAGQAYTLSLMTAAVRHEVARIAVEIADGRPEFARLGVTFTPKPCSSGIGSNGGRSRGAGSGSRLRLWECDCETPVKVRVASDAFAAHCDVCEAPFHKVEKTVDEAPA